MNTKLEKILSEHWTIGKVTLYGENAMHWAVEISTKRYGYIGFRLPFLCFGRWWPMYLYFSPNSTPWASTFYLGSDKMEKIKAKMRKQLFGHNFDTADNRKILQMVNRI